MLGPVINVSEVSADSSRDYTQLHQPIKGFFLFQHPENGWVPVMKLGDLIYYLGKNGNFCQGGHDSTAGRFKGCSIKPLPTGYTITITGNGQFQ